MLRLPVLLVLATIAGPAFAQYEDAITVSRILLDVRVTKAGGEPILDLTPDDFTVTVGGAQARVVSASWTDESGGAPVVEASPDGENAPLRPVAAWERARLIVVFVQTDFGRNGTRVRQQMGFNRYADDIVRSFHPDDRVAVLSFDSHLKLRSDFTNDRDAIVKAIRDSIAIDIPPPPASVAEPSLAKLLDRDAMKRATSTEEALVLLGKALTHIEGPKSLLLAGWGLGERNRFVVVMRPEWREARAALLDARVTLFALNTGTGGELTAGLEAAAHETGGFHVRSWDMPQQMVNRIERTMRGRYELELVTGKPLPAGTHAIDIRVKRRGALVLAATSITLSEQ
jgi:VWFA-related protein